jgi:hypothetical protein
MKSQQEFRTRETLMTHFSVGDQVVIRYGRQQGQKGKIIRTQLADVYEVKVLDGSILFFSSKGLDKEGATQAVRVKP